MRILFALLFALLTAPLSATERAHQHGQASLQVALDGNTLEITFDGAADNILGFEHAPKTEKQKQTAQRAEQRLRQANELFLIPPAASCVPEPAKVEFELPAAGSREVHADVEATWRWQCAAPSKVGQIDVMLFKTFPHLKQLRVQMTTPAGQSSAQLQRGRTRLTLKQ